MSNMRPALSDVFDDLPDWEQKQILGDVRGAYIYARSAAQRPVARIAAGKHPESDAIFESIWWIAACDGYLFTAFGPRWSQYKAAQPWADLVNGILWARNQTSHDPLAIAPVFDLWRVVDGAMERRPEWLWAPHNEVPKAEPAKENEAFAAA